MLGKYKRSLLLHYTDYSGNIMKYGGNLLSICYTHFKSIFIAALVPVLKVYFYYKIEEIKNVCAFFSQETAHYQIEWILS